MSDQTLEYLFDSPVKVRLLKLFMRNPEKSFLTDDIIKRTQSDENIAKTQLKKLEIIGLLKKKVVVKLKKNELAPGVYYGADQTFEFYPELERLILKSSPTSKEKILRKIVKLGRIKMALIGGVFLNTDNSRVDLFLVGDDISHTKLRHFLAEVESDVGKEIEFAAMDTREFDYRFRMFDRFVRDILEKPHEKLINKLRFIDQVNLS